MVHRKLHLGTLGSFVSAVVAILISDREKSITSEAGPSNEYSSQVFVAIGKSIFFREDQNVNSLQTRTRNDTKHWQYLTKRV